MTSSGGLPPDDGIDQRMDTNATGGDASCRLPRVQISERTHQAVVAIALLAAAWLAMDRVPATVVILIFAAVYGPSVAHGLIRR
jgi:hypothetical protein